MEGKCEEGTYRAGRRAISSFVMNSIVFLENRPIQLHSDYTQVTNTRNTRHNKNDNVNVKRTIICSQNLVQSMAPSGTASAIASGDPGAFGDPVGDPGGVRDSDLVQPANALNAS